MKEELRTTPVRSWQSDDAETDDMRAAPIRKAIYALLWSLLTLLAVCVVTVVVYFSLIWPLEVDTCLDRGGCWNDCDARCEYDDQAACNACRPSN